METKEDDPYFFEPWNHNIQEEGLYIPKSDRPKKPVNIDKILDKIALEHPELVSRKYKPKRRKKRWNSSKY